jgi:hypothetical protein
MAFVIRGKERTCQPGSMAPMFSPKTRRVCVLASIKKTDGLSMLPS